MLASDIQDRRLIAETIRHIEISTGPLPGDADAGVGQGSSSSGVEGRILERAARIGDLAGIPEILGHVKSVAGRISMAGLVIAALLGGLAGAQAVAAEHQTINFYWLLIALLGINFVTLLLWLITMLRGAVHFRPGVIPAAFSSALRGIAKRRPGFRQYEYPAATAFISNRLGGPAGRWIAGSIAHGFWSAYLLGGILVIFTLLAARQYDFVWETTLLPDTVFIRVTAWLSWLPQSLGLEIPTSTQVLGSRPAAEPDLLAGARRAWATLLLASLLLYGLAPRLLLLVVCRRAGAARIRSTPLDLGHPYYVQLRQQLTPISEPIGVVDADDEYEGSTKTVPHANPGDCAPPADALWTAVELDPETPWPPPGVTERQNLGSIDDGAGRDDVLGRLSRNSNPVVVAVSLARTADRGLSHLVAQISEPRTTRTWLALLETHSSDNLSQRERSARTTQWYSLAAAQAIPADQVFHLRIDQPAPTDSDSIQKQDSNHNVDH